MSETSTMHGIMLAIGNGAVRVWRNNLGMLWDKNGRAVRFGVANPGGSDLLGYKTVRITADMVGQDIAQFIAIEVKEPRGVVTAAQANFIAAVNEAGGRAGVCRTVDEALRLIDAP